MIFKEIPGYEGFYEVSTDGVVRSMDRVIEYSDGRVFNYKGKKLSFQYNKQGYKYVHLYMNSKRKAITMHRLVALTFISNPNKFREVNHVNGDKLDNRVQNLEWTTRSKNMKHGFKTGLINNTGINNGSNVYTEDQIIHVKTLLKQGKYTQRKIVEITGVKIGTVEQVAQNKQWKHIKV